MLHLKMSSLEVFMYRDVPEWDVFKSSGNFGSCLWVGVDVYSVEHVNLELTWSDSSDGTGGTSVCSRSNDWASALRHSCA